MQILACYLSTRRVDGSRECVGPRNWLAAPPDKPLRRPLPRMSLEPVPPAVKVNPSVVLGIDFLRGSFSILVLVAHALVYAFELFPTHGSLRGYWPSLYATLGSGGFSVRGFFVVSGFCINLSVINALATGAYSARGYLLARVTRIYPMYLAGLGLAVLAWWVNREWLPGENSRTQWFDWPALLAELVMAQGFYHCLLFYGISWTLTAEVTYYAAWPYAVRLCGGAGARTAISASLASVGVALVIVVLWKVFAGGSATSWMLPFWTVPASAPLWFSGAWLAGCWRNASSSTSLRRLRPLLWLLLPAAYALQSYVGYVDPRAWINVLHQYACVPAYLLLILYFQPMAVPGVTAQRVCRYFGELSYPLYLLHYPVIAVTGAVLKRFDLCRGPWQAFVIVTLASLLISGLPGVALESAIMRWRKSFLQRSGVKSPGVPARPIGNAVTST